MLTRIELRFKLHYKLTKVAQDLEICLGKGTLHYD